MKDLSKGIPDKWRLFFKLFCFFSPQNVPLDSIEAAFMFEQVNTNSLSQRYTIFIYIPSVNGILHDMNMIKMFHFW